ncbi:MAG: FHA domain-containing protein, partial [Phycisphaerales bacterium]
MGMTKDDSSGKEERDIQVEFPSLVGTAGEFEGQIVRLAKKMRLGRHRENDVRFGDPTVSAFHAQITAVGDSYEVVDLGSKNRSRLNGKKISRPVFLADNDMLMIGRSNFRFKLPQVERAEHTYSTSNGNSISESRTGPRSSGEIVCSQMTNGPHAVCHKRATVGGDAEGPDPNGMAQPGGER